MKFCEQCGTELSADARFCSICGAPTGKKSLSELADEVTTFQTRSSCRRIFSGSDKSKASSALSVRKYYDSLLSEEAIGGPLLGVTPPNSKGEIGHFGNGFFDVLFTQNYIAISSESGGPTSNAVVGFKKNSGNQWGVIFPISEMASVRLNKCIWKMSFSDGYIQEAEYWYLVIEPRIKTRPSGSSGFWPLDLAAYPDRGSFKFGFSFENNQCPRALWQTKDRLISSDSGDGVWYIGLPLEESGEFSRRRVLANALAKEISHYPNFKINESVVITSNTNHSVAGPTNRTQGFSFAFFDM